jgi:hypothetical protein
MVFMKIDSHAINLSSSRVYEEKNQETEELREWGKRKGPRTLQENLTATDRQPRNLDRVSLSEQARSAVSASAEQNTASVSTPADQTGTADEEQGLDSRLLILKRMIEAFTGHEIKIARIDSQAQGSSDLPENNAKAESSPSDQPREQEWGMSYTHYESHYESEQTRFSAQGIVRTADGKDIAFSMDLAMSREYFSEDRLEIKAGAPLIDPLVINYAGTSAELSDMSFEFDLTMDGRNETMRQLAPGSGFLVFDRNRDGKVNDGSELFGPKTGDGFDELAAYDEDNNNWIDENDSIYKDLSLWRKENGADSLIGLKAANVGAIYLGNADTSFDLKNETNDLMAQVRKTGVYLKENGGAGTIQQIDFSA